MVQEYTVLYRKHVPRVSQQQTEVVIHRGECPRQSRLIYITQDSTVAKREHLGTCRVVIEGLQL